MKKKTSDSDKKKFWSNCLIKFVFAVILLFLIGVSVVFTILDNKVIAMGEAGFIRDAFWRIVLGMIAAVSVFFCVKGIFQHKNSLKGILGRIVGAFVCLVLAVFLIRPVILDIPYFDHPVITYLTRLTFDDDHTGDGAARFYLRGTGIDGQTHSFSLNEEVYRKGRELKTENFELRAKVVYLPHTDIVISLQYLTELDEQAEELFPPSDDLENDWESFAIQINDRVYQLPTPLSVFLEDGWRIAEEDVHHQLAGAAEPYERYDSQEIELVNDQGQSLDITVYNTTEKTMDIAQGTVGSLYVIYGNYEFAGTELRVPGGLMLGWATREDILQQYGVPDDSFEELSITYQADGFGSAYWHFYFDESGYLHKVMVHNQAYYRDN